MSAYWRSPYREPTNSFRHHNNSTLKFEQSLYLSRSRTSIHSSKYDWLDMALNSPTDNNGKHSSLVRSNTSIKSILKTPRRDHCLIPGKYADKDMPGELTPVNKQVSKKDKKKVTFGLNENVEVENDGTRSSIYLRNRKFQLATMNRISHSRLLEESALEKLNRLMGVSAQSTSLPSVTGKGLLSPRPTTAKPSKSACSHSTDLKCRRCIRKDTEIGNNEKLSEKLNMVPNLVPIGTLQCKDDKTVEENPAHFSNPWSENAEDDTIHEQTVAENRENTITEIRPSNKEEVHNSLPSSGFDNGKKHSRLLPGRYSFNTGAMQIQKLMISDGHNEDIDRKAAVVIEETNVDLQNGRVETGNKSNAEENHESSQKKTPRGANENGRASTAYRIPTIMPSSILHADPGAIVTEKGGNKQNSFDEPETDSKKHKPSKEKTSRILDWLNDVNRKQTFKPGLAHLHVLESR